ncbi:ATP-dependent RNA helicase TDRD9 [Araneus ventricosus]|uniref:ATP-dependent RNA helicase TDRD9 n=1 Tax=Araneus ventricosus TaxID=182803 RepID=A0A4Y2D7N6_ARAVE|nr:ATP-dependent RNA helicase TDRD9 [Araneus ventricosus]
MLACILFSAASLSLQSFFARPFDKALDAYRSRRSWADGTFSDCLCFLNAHRVWKQLSTQGQFRRPGGITEDKWCENNYIQKKRIKEVNLLVKDIQVRLERLNIFVDRRERFANAEESNTLILKMVIAGAFFPYYYIQQPLDEIQISKDINENDPRSTVLVTGLPPNHGILYATALKEMLTRCSQNISIEFEESKAYIRFMSKYDENKSLVHPEVYMAVKMRKLDMKLWLALFSHEEAESKTRQLLSSRCSSSSSLLKSSNRITVSEESIFKRIPLPPLEQSTSDIFITQVNSCGSFWARYTTHETNRLVMFLETTINNNKGRNLKHLTKPPKLNGLYLAPYSEGSNEPLYYRAQVMEIEPPKVSIFFVDYGNAETINISELREIPESTPDVLNTPCLAFECHLAEVKPLSYKSPNGQWSPEANMWFKTQISGKILHSKEVVIRRKMVKFHMDSPRYMLLLDQWPKKTCLSLLRSLNDRTLNLEGMLLGFLSDKSLPFAVAPDRLELVKEMSKDRKALNRITMHRNAASYKTRFGISQTVKEALFEDLQKEFFSLNLDESTNSNNRKIVTLVVSYMTENGNISTKHLSSYCVDNVNSETIF